MIQFNLLPDVKLQYIKAQKTRRLVVTVALLIAVVSVVLLAFALSIDGLQKKHLSDLTNSVTSESKQLQAVPHIDSILTVQNQLESLTALHAGKYAASRLFPYLNQVTPSAVSITNFTTDFTAQTATITGTAASLGDVNQYVDTLKATNYTVQDSSTTTHAFSNVVLSSFGVSTTAKNGQEANYSISLAYDKTIFDITQAISLSVPSQVTTRVQANQPSDLFKASDTPLSNGVKK